LGSVEAASIGLGGLAGVLSVLSPCVLPLLPLVLGAAASVHRWGVVALAAGLTVSFTALGLFVATIGAAIGLDGEVVRDLSATLLVLVGVVLCSERLQQRFASVTAGFGNAGNRAAGRIRGQGLGGQFLLGAVLGAVWSPCVGPTLGAASLLAAQGRALGQVAAVMLAFGVGAAVPLLLIGSVSRQAMLRWRGRLMQVGKGGKRVLGVVTVAVGAMILTGIDHRVETVLVSVSPAWLSDVTTRY
jgi:cytochrome c biogenesis protein CcdA